MKRLLLIKNQNDYYSVDLTFVKSIHGIDTVHMDPDLGMIMQLDRQKIPVVNFSSFIIDEPFDPKIGTGKIILFQLQSKAFALKVDQIERIIGVEDHQIEPIPPTFRGYSQICFPQVLKRDDTLILIMSPDGIAQKLFMEKIEQPEQIPLVDMNVIDAQPYEPPESIMQLIPDIEMDKKDDRLQPSALDLSAIQIKDQPVVETEDIFPKIDIETLETIQSEEKIPDVDIEPIPIERFEDITPEISDMVVSEDKEDEEEIILLTDEITIPEKIELSEDIDEDDRHLYEKVDDDSISSEEIQKRLEDYLTKMLQSAEMEKRIFNLVSGFFEKETEQKIKKIKQMIVHHSRLSHESEFESKLTG